MRTQGANENGLFNRWYARPAVLDLLGIVAGVSPGTPPELLSSSESDPTRFIGFIFFALEAAS